MARNGTDEFYYPPGTAAEPNEVAYAAHVNQRFDEIKNDLNSARPVTMGGTGAVTAAAARTNLGAASQADHEALEGRVQPIDKGGTGAVSAADARTALAVPGAAVGATISGSWTYTGTQTWNIATASQVFQGDGAATQTSHRWMIGTGWTWTLRQLTNGDLEFNKQAAGGEFRVSGQLVYHAGNLTIATLGGVPTARTVTAGGGLTGGGDLSENRSFAVDGTVARRNAANDFTTTPTVGSNALWHAGNSPTLGTTAVGALAFMQNRSGTDIGAGATLLGSALRYASISHVDGSIYTGTAAGPAGTWRCLGNCLNQHASLFVRIS